MPVYGLKYEYNNGPFSSNVRARNLNAASEWDAKMRMFNILREKEAKQGRILHFIDIDFWSVERLLDHDVV